MPRDKQPEQRFPVRLTEAQRKLVAQIDPGLAERLRLDEPYQRTIELTLAELKSINEKARAAHGQATSGMVRNSLRHVVDLTAQAIERCQGAGAIPAGERIYQFKITLLDVQPAVWRRIQVKDCTLDKLHEHIQTSMGWTNSHLHDFKIGGKNYGDPLLMAENFEEFDYADSTTTKLSAVLPKTGKRFRFEYHYDFGDSWRHEVLFEGCLPAEPGGRYPVCLEGARACPPEDVGGAWGYEEFLAALADPHHEQHYQVSRWIGGSFDPAAFDPAAATKRMKKGLPDWRSERWI
jgi:hypothetical protein